MVNGGWPVGMFPILPIQQGVCSVCHQYNRQGWGECRTCTDNLTKLNLKPIPRSGLLQSLETRGTHLIAVLPLFLRVRGQKEETDAYSYMWKYKDGTQLERERAGAFIQDLCDVAAAHEACLAARLQMVNHKFDYVLTVPSKQGRSAIHPLGEAVSQSVMGGRLRNGLKYVGPARATKDKRNFPVSQWEVDQQLVKGKNIIVLDDLWTKGWTALSAATALIGSGAKRVGVIPLGRHLVDTEGDFTSLGFRELTKDLEWSSSFCALCDDRMSAIANPPLPRQ